MTKVSPEQIDLMCELMQAKLGEPKIIMAVGGKGVYHLAGEGLTKEAIDEIFNLAGSDFNRAQSLANESSNDIPTFKQVLPK